MKKARKAAPKRKRLAKQRDKLISVIRASLEDDDASRGQWKVLVEGGMSPEEAAIFDIPKPPPGFAYQWSPVLRAEYMLMKGWSKVPYSRHPELPRALNFDGYVVYRDMALFQISAELARAEHDRMKELALDMERDFAEGSQRADSYSCGNHAHGRFYVFPPSFIVSSDYERVGEDEPDKLVPVMVPFMMPARWQDAANALKMPHDQYIRRRITQEGFLLSADPAGLFRPYDTEDLTIRKVD